MIVYFQPVQDIQIATRISRAQYQYTLTGTNAEEVSLWAERLAERLQSSPIMRDVASEAQDEGLRLMVHVDRELAGRLGVSLQTVNDTLNSAFGQRQISTIYAQSNQYRVILEAMPQYQSDPNSLSRLYVPGTGGVQVPLSALRPLRAHHRAAGDRALRAVPGGDHQLQPGAARLAQRRGRDHQRSRSARSACRPP